MSQNPIWHNSLRTTCVKTQRPHMIHEIEMTIRNSKWLWSKPKRAESGQTALLNFPFCAQKPVAWEKPRQVTCQGVSWKDLFSPVISTSTSHLTTGILPNLSPASRVTHWSQFCFNFSTFIRVMLQKCILLHLPSLISILQWVSFNSRIKSNTCTCFHLCSLFWLYLLLIFPSFPGLSHTHFFYVSWAHCACKHLRALLAALNILHSRTHTV